MQQVYFFVRFTGRLFEARMAPNVVLKILVRIFARNRDEKRGRSHLVENAYTVRRFFCEADRSAYLYTIYNSVGRAEQQPAALPQTGEKCSDPAREETVWTPTGVN